MNRRLLWHKEEVEEVIKLLATSKTTREIEEILDDILTPKEINDMARRRKVLLLLKQGKSYIEIAQETGMSHTTIARISAKIGYGFRKSVEGNKNTVQKAKEWKPPKKVIRYKGVRI